MAVTDMRAWMKMVIRRIVKLERAQLRVGRSERLRYKSGFSLDAGTGQVHYGGFVSGGNKQLFTKIELPFSVPEGVNPVVTSFKANVRGPSGYWSLGSYTAGGRELVGMSGVTFQSSIENGNLLILQIANTSNWFSVNNTVVSWGISKVEVQFS